MTEYFVAVDYAQLEARILAMLSKDEVFCHALWNGLDIHEKWALRALQAEPDLLNILEFNKKDDKDNLKDLRSWTKNKWVFALFYGAGLKSVSTSMHLDINVVKDIIENEFKKEYPGVFSWQDEQMQFYKEHFYIESFFGRRRHAPLSKNEIINHPIQSTASDIVTSAGYRLAKYAYFTKQNRFQWRLNVHDDISSSIAEKTLSKDILFIAKEMVRPLWDFIIVPLGVEVSIGTHWGSIEEIQKYYTTDFWDYVGEGIWREK